MKISISKNSLVYQRVRNKIQYQATFLDFKIFLQKRVFMFDMKTNLWLI